MGQDREDGQGGDAGLTPAGQQQVFEVGLTRAGRQQVLDAEITAAVRYEKGLAGKAVIALVLVALVIVARLIFYG